MVALLADDHIALRAVPGTGSSRTAWRSKTLPQILFVDDQRDVLDGIRRVLRRYSHIWEMHFEHDSPAAWEHIQTRPTDCVVLDITMPRLSGIEILQRMQSNAATRDIPAIMLTGIGDAALKHQMIDLGAADLLNKPVHPAELQARLRSILRIKTLQDELQRQNELLEVQVESRTRQLRRSRMEIVWRLAKAAEFRDVDTGEHVMRVALYSRILAEGLGLPREYCDDIFLASPLHDIGKLGISDAILLKPGPLTDAERRTMEEHCEIGYRILQEPSLSELCFLEESENDCLECDEMFLMAQQIALSHHERWNGTGYPKGLLGEQIPLAARIVAIADVYDAVASPRPYKSAWSEQDAQQAIRNGAGTQFDGHIVNVFLKSIKTIQDVRTRAAETAASVGRVARSECPAEESARL